MKKFVFVATVVNSIMIVVSAKQGDYTMMGMHMMWASSGSAYLLK